MKISDFIDNFLYNVSAKNCVCLSGPQQINYGHFRVSMSILRGTFTNKLLSWGENKIVQHAEAWIFKINLSTCTILP